MSEEDGLICAFALDGKGGGKPLGWPEIRSHATDGGFLWVHLDRYGSETDQWLREESSLDHLVCEALLADETRPRCTAFPGGLFINLRGLNLNPGANPEDMVSIRIWLEDRRVITVRRRRLLSIDDLRESVDQGRGPMGAGDFLETLSRRLAERMEPTIAAIADSVDELEDSVLTAESGELRAALSGYRRQAIAIKRYIAPQREALLRAVAEPVSWLTQDHRNHLGEIANRITRYVEDLDAARERAAVTHEELVSRLSEQMNRTIYLLSVIAGVFLPLGLLTGLLGINVAGMPGAQTSWAFWAVCALLLVVAVFEIWIFRRFKWL